MLIGNFTQPKLPFLKSTTIFCPQWMTVKSQHWLCSTFPRPLIPYYWFGVSGKALDWFKSYLTGRCQGIRLGGRLSSKSDITFGVPEVSVLGPLLSTLYTALFSSLISGHAIPHHLYADDSQLYVSVSSGDSAAALNGLQSYLASSSPGCSTNKLQLNPDKTEFLLIGNERQWSRYLSVFPIELAAVKTYYLGVTLDKNSTFAYVCLRSAVHVFTASGIYWVFAVTLIWIAQNCLYLPSSCLLGYCNSLLCGIADTDLAKLQSILNRLAREVTKSPPFIRSVSLLRSLHWLPAKYRVHFKICLLTYKALLLYTLSLLATLFRHVYWDQTKESLCRSLGSRPTPALGHLGLAPLPCGTAFHYLSVQLPQLLSSGDISKHIFSTWPPPIPVDTGARWPVDATQ